MENVWHDITEAHLAKTNTEEFISAMKKEYYVGDEGTDLIDDWALRLSPEKFRAVMLAMIEKYGRRYDMKDAPLTEAIKIRDYANRLVEFEQNLEDMK